MDSDLLEEKEKFASDKEFFDEQRAGLENERKHLTDAAIKLGHEVGSVQNNIPSFGQLSQNALRDILELRMED